MRNRAKYDGRFEHTEISFSLQWTSTKKNSANKQRKLDVKTQFIGNIHTSKDVSSHNRQFELICYNTASLLVKACSQFRVRSYSRCSTGVFCVAKTDGQLKS